MKKLQKHGKTISKRVYPWTKTANHVKLPGRGVCSPTREFGKRSVDDEEKKQYIRGSQETGATKYFLSILKREKSEQSGGKGVRTGRLLFGSPVGKVPSAVRVVGAACPPPATRRACDVRAWGRRGGLPAAEKTILQKGSMLKKRSISGKWLRSQGNWRLSTYGGNWLTTNMSPERTTSRWKGRRKNNN